MMQIRLMLLALLLATAPFSRADECAPKGFTDIAVTRSADGALASYRFAEAISCLSFLDRGDVRKLTWRLLSPGAVLSEDGNTVQFDAPRTDFAVRLRAFDHDGAIDRVYSPLIAFGDGAAVAVYTNYLYPAARERGVAIAFDGFAPTAAERPVGPQRIGLEQTYIVVGKPMVERRGKVAAVIDQAMPAWLLSNVNNAITQGETALHGVTNTPRPLTYLVTYTEPKTPHANWRGDTLDKLVRLNFMGAPWQQGQAGNKDAVDYFILHELFHTAISPALNPHLPGAMTLSEGGAEAGAIAMRGSYPAAPDRAAAIDKALATCQELTGKTLADKEQTSQRQAPYACGVALQSMVAAAAKRDPLAIWASLLRKSTPVDAGWPAFMAAASERGQVNQAAMATLGEMAASQIAWDSGIARLAASGLLRRRTEAELALPAFACRYRQAAVFHLLKHYCSQRYGFFTEPGAFILDAPDGQCGGVPDKFRAVAMNGIDLERDAYQAYHVLARHCADRLPVELTDDQGKKIALACAKPPDEIVIYTLS